MSRARTTRNISRRGCPSSRPTRRRFSPPHRKRRKPQRFSPHFRWHSGPCPLGYRSSRRCLAVPQRIDHSHEHLCTPAPRSRLSLRSCPGVSVTAWRDGRRAQALLIVLSKIDARPATSRLCPVLPTRRSPSKPNGFPPTGCPPLRHSAEALLTAHSIRIGDRTGIEVASSATSKLERTSDD